MSQSDKLYMLAYVFNPRQLKVLAGASAVPQNVGYSYYLYVICFLGDCTVSPISLNTLSHPLIPFIIILFKSLKLYSLIIVIGLIYRTEPNRK